MEWAEVLEKCRQVHQDRQVIDVSPVFLPVEFYGQKSQGATVHGVAKSQT